MTRTTTTYSIPAALVTLTILALASPATAGVAPPPSTLELTVTPYFAPGYRVGLAASWEPLPEAEVYRVTHFRQDACGSATVTHTTTGLSSGSGLHPNCGAPDSCYFRQVTVDAMDLAGTVVASAEDSFCEVGYLDEPPQDSFLTDLPPNVPNTRFFPDLFVGMRPALTFRGFDCEDPDLEGGCDHGLGLKQVLESAYATTPDPLVRDTYVKLLRLAIATPLRQDSDTKEGSVNVNANVLQSRAFLALATYVMDQNGFGESQYQLAGAPAIPSPAEALEIFKQTLFDPPNDILFMHDAANADGVKWTTAATNVMRAIDLYLALENAYCHYQEADCDDPSSTALLTREEKRALLDDLLYDHMLDLERKLRNPLGVPERGQPGNWPLKIRLALGYAALTQQHTQPLNELRIPFLVEWLEKAYENIEDQNGKSRHKRWSYQSSSGERFWAESAFYFHLTLPDAIPFFHAIRSNELLRWNGFEIADPFRDPLYANPLGWLADTVTPEGRIMPLDDGNKAALRHSNMMRWSPEYGDGALGEKFAWIHGRDLNTNFDNPSIHTRLVELAIPRTAIERPPEPEVLNTTPPFGEGEQQLVLRHDDARGETHYVVLNGERGDAIVRGEGHEQPDQMQLLYYVGGHSFLLDSGYDSAERFKISTWNRYQDHNVMQVYPFFVDILPERPGDYDPPGIPRPFLDIRRMRKVSEHNGVDELYHDGSPNVDVLHSSIVLRTHDVAGDVVDAARYLRRVFFIDDSEAPYLIDLNLARSFAFGGHQFLMSYHGNSNEMSRTPGRDGYALWQGIDETTDQHLFVFPATVEREMFVHDGFMVHSDNSDEPDRNADVPIQRLDVYGVSAEGLTVRDEHTTVAFIRALVGVEPWAIDSAVGQLPVQKRTGENRYYSWNYYTWTQERADEEIVDVFVTRSAVVYRAPGLRTILAVTVDEAGGARLALPAEDDYGFARFRRPLGNPAAEWTLDPRYQVNLGTADETTLVISENAFLRTYRGLVGNVTYDTGIAEAGHACGVVGTAVRNGDIEEKERGTVLQSYAFRANGTWHLRADFRTENADKRWDLRLLCLSTTVAEMGRSTSGKPFFIESFRNLGDNVGSEDLGGDRVRDTGIPTADYLCGIVGMAAYSGDINERDTGGILKAFLYRDGSPSTWHIRADFRTHRPRGGEDWDLDVLCASTDVAATGAASGAEVFFERYFDLGDDVDREIDVSTDEYACGVTGMAARDGDINENDTGDVLEIYLEEGPSGKWRIVADFLTHLDHETWDVEVMCLRRAPAVALNLVATPYYDVGYRVGLAATWDAVPGATLYRVTHFRQDACGSATVTHTTTGLSSGSGRHRNCGAPDSCYFREATVEALDAAGGVIVTESASFCEVGFP